MRTSASTRAGARESMSELERFLALLADRLSRGICQEEAFRETLRVYDGALRGSLERAEVRVTNGVPLEEALFRLGLESSLPEFKGVILIASRLIARGSKEAGERILLMVSRLRENRRLVEERDALVKAMSFKVQVLTVGCSISAALITVLLPAFSALTNLGRPVWSGAGLGLFGSWWTLAAVLSVACSISAYYAASASLGGSPLRLSLMAMVSYWVIFLAAFALLGRLF